MLPHLRICLCALTAGTPNLLRRPCTDRSSPGPKTWSKRKAMLPRGPEAVVTVALRLSLRRLGASAPTSRPARCGRTLRATRKHAQHNIRLVSTTWASFGTACAGLGDQIQVIGPHRQVFARRPPPAAAEPFKGACSFWATNALNSCSVNVLVLSAYCDTFTGFHT